MGKSIARKLTDSAQKAIKGRQALRYEFEVIPYFCGELPEGVDKVLFAWERGTKLFVTDAEPVNHNTHAAFWKQYLRQAATVYKEHNEFVAKEYSFKVQEVRSKSKGDERKTIGKVHIDLAQFCSGEADGEPQEVFLQLKPAGKLKCSIKATWQRNAKVDPDAMTEATGDYAQSHGAEEEWDEQDLSGFDPHAGEAANGGHASTSGHDHDGEYDEETGERKRRKKKKKHRKREHMPEEIPEGFDVPDDEYDGQAHAGGEGGADGTSPAKPPKPRSSQPKDPATMETGRQIQGKTGLRDILCCCFPRTGAQQDALEKDALLNQQRAIEMRTQRAAMASAM